MMPRARLARADLHSPSSFGCLEKHRLIVQLVVAHAQHLGEGLRSPLALRADAADDQPLLEAQGRNLHDLAPLADLARHVAQGQRQLVHELLRLETTVFVITLTVVPHDRRVLDFGLGTRSAPREELHDWLHLVHPLHRSLRVELNPLVLRVRAALPEPVLCDQGEWQVAAEVLLEELLAATAHDEDPDVLSLRQAPEELPGRLRGHGILHPSLELPQRAVVVEEHGLDTWIGLEEEVSY
mmetsp:Transcript_34932/g.78961  ORF Transcript_34932/g.78961 Transcript_34932/m.78961 type:complete len:240 (-) Transcript_34932:23-742(-)